MAHKIPDEILKEILSLALKIDDDMFEDTSYRSPFSFPTQSKSVFLTVCKRWLRVSTPLLYNVVVLRSAAQAQALARVLKKNKEFGRFIRKIRVEGGFGAAMERILSVAHNTTDVHILLEIWSNDNVSGLCKGLPLLNPSHVILWQGHRECFNSQVRLLYNTLGECMKTWKNMKTIGIPGSVVQEGSILRGLANSSSVEKIYMKGYYNLSHLQAVARIPSLKTIEVKFSDLSLGLLTQINADPKLLALIEHRTRSKSTTSFLKSDVHELLTPKPDYFPMACASTEVQDKIWLRILKFTLEIPSKITVDLLQKPARNRGSLPLVSKRFQRLSTPLLYHSPVIQDAAGAILFANQLAANPSLAAHIRFLDFSCWYFSDHDTRNILSLTSGLVDLANHQVPRPEIRWDDFNVLAKKSGSTITTFRGFRIAKSSVVQSPSIFDRFDKLHTLTWSCNTLFQINAARILCTALPSLTTIEFVLYNRTFADFLSRMELPSLKNVKFITPTYQATNFLMKHGSKILQLEVHDHDANIRIFELCPNMTLLTYRSLEHEPEFFQCENDHHSLVKILLSDGYLDGKEFYKSFTFHKFRALKEIEVTRIRWPTTTREIAKDWWHKWSDELLKQGIKLTDRDGIQWRPRLGCC